MIKKRMFYTTGIGEVAEENIGELSCRDKVMRVVQKFLIPAQVMYDIGFFGFKLEKLIPHQIKPVSFAVAQLKNFVNRIKQLAMLGGIIYILVGQLGLVGSVSIQ